MDEQINMELFFEIFDATMPRLGPGDDASTLRALQIALSAWRGPGDAGGEHGPRVLDLGCGNGAPTMVLARHSGGSVLAVDFHRPFLDELERRARANGAADRIRVLECDLAELRLEDGSFDLIWAEGSLFVLSFAEGLGVCRTLLAPGGVMAATELAWLVPDPPAECRDFFAAEYPPMTDVAANLAAVEACGFEMLEHFVLPLSSWSDQYIAPLQKRLDAFRARSGTDAERQVLIERVQREIDVFEKYGDSYGNVFFVMRRRE